MKNITYRQVNDYMIPNLTLPPEEANIMLGKWGMLHKDYLEKHNRVFLNLLLTQGKLYRHCADVENQARVLFDMLVEQMKEAEGVTELLKEKNQMAWIQKMSIIYQKAKDVVVNDLICK